MHKLNCLVSVQGDLNNRAPKMGITVPELMVLEHIHGPGSVTDVFVAGVVKVDQLAERERLLYKYPKHDKLIIGLWRDNGGKFVSDVRNVKFLSAGQFSNTLEHAHSGADKIEEELVDAAMQAEKSAAEPTNDLPGIPDIEEAEEEAELDPLI